MLLIYLIILCCIIFIYLHWFKHRKVKRWLKDLKINKHLTAYLQLYTNVDGFSLSKQARMEHDSLEYVYGEINFISFIALLSLCHPDVDTVFYDLGSGVGRAVIACAMVFNVKQSCGIEILPLLHECAVNMQQKLALNADYKNQASHIIFTLGNFLDYFFTDASLIFINSTAFFGNSWRNISQHLEQVKHGTIIISTSKALYSNGFKIFKTTQVEMSWGVVTAFLQIRQ